MKTISLRTLLRDPLRIARMTRAGKSITVTEKGEPLWILRPANGTGANEAERIRAIDEVLDEVLREKRSKISLSKIVGESRR
jgi:hypothetical protein